MNTFPDARPERILQTFVRQGLAVLKLLVGGTAKRCSTDKHSWLPFLSLHSRFSDGANWLRVSSTLNLSIHDGSSVIMRKEKKLQGDSALGADREGGAEVVKKKKSSRSNNQWRVVVIFGGRSCTLAYSVLEADKLEKPKPHTKKPEKSLKIPSNIPHTNKKRNWLAEGFIPEP